MGEEGVERVVETQKLREGGRGRGREERGRNRALSPHQVSKGAGVL